jgi:putative membrane protein
MQFQGKVFMKSPLARVRLALLVFSLPLLLNAADSASTADKTFVAKVSQGGMYEVEASKVALEKAVAQDIKDMANTEVHDHQLVNHELIKIANAGSVDVAPQLNSQFQQRLEALKSASGAQFDAAYANDMAQIHDMDEKLFAKEAVEGSGSFRAFAAKTDLIVKRHIGAIHGADPQ